MKLKFGALLAAAILGTCLSPTDAAASSSASSTLSAGAEPRRLQVCSAYLPIDYSPTSGTTIFWTNGGGNDAEWLNVNNWQYGYLPGVHRFNRLIMAVNDVATVHCDATYMAADISLEARSGANLDVSANLNIGDQLVLKTNANFNQYSTSVVTVGKNLYLAAIYSLANTAHLSIGLDLYMASNAKLTIEGDVTTLEASKETPSHSRIHGEIKYIFGPTGTGSFDLGGALTIGSTTAKLIVDASAYVDGNKSIPLIKYASVVGAFSAANIVISGLASGMDGQVVPRSDGLYLDISGGSDPTPSTASPTPGPTRSPIQTPVTSNPTPSPVKPPTAAPVTVNPSSSPVKPPTATPVTSDPSSSPVKPQTAPPVTSDPTVHPTTGNPSTSPHKSPSSSPMKPPTSDPSHAPTTKNPSTSPIASPTSGPVDSTPEPTNSPESSSVTRITLTETGLLDPITRFPGVCPAAETTSIVIDGKDYIGGPGTISLYECSTINASYDLMNIRLVNFPEGLWFELAYKSDSIDLVIKSLANYKEYWAHVRNSYVVGEYAEQVHTDHFPDFNWDKVPTWVRFRKNSNVVANPQPWNYNAGPWKDEEIELIAKNHFLSWYGLNTPEHVIETWERIKNVPAANHTHKSIYYWNAESFWGTDGIGLQQDYLRSGAVGTGGRKLYDHTNLAMRDWWVAHGLEMSQQAASDGVFTDNTISRECDNAMCDLEGTDKSKMVKRLAETVPDDVLDIGNYLRQMIDTGNRFRMAYADGSYFENTHFSPGNQNDLEGILVSMQLAREVSWKKKIVMWTGSRRNCGCGFNNDAFPWCTPYEDLATTPDHLKVIQNCVPEYCRGFVQQSEEPTALLQHDLEIAMAEFLIIVEKWSYANFNISPDASCEDWRWDWSHMDLLNRPIGAPLGPPLKSGHTFSRHFEHLSVKISIKKETYDDSAHGVGGDVTYIWR